MSHTSFAEKCSHRVPFWSPENAKKPDEVAPYDNTKYAFICEKGHHFFMALSDVSYNHWCGLCYEENITWTKEKMLAYTIEENDCLLWKGSEKVGYRSDYYQKHRLMYMFCHPNVDITDEYVYRTCGNTQCINPDHLDLGKLKSMGINKDKRGTQKNGEKHYCSQFTDKLAVEIRNLFDDGIETSCTKVAKKYNVSRKAVSNLKNRKSYTHLLSESEHMANRIHFRNITYNIKNQTITKVDYLNCWKRILNQCESKDNICTDIRFTLNTPCLIFTGLLSRDGYGRTTVKLHDTKTHIISAIIHNNHFKPLEEGQGVRHLCAHKNCCEPTHLEIGTPVQNTIDRMYNNNQKNAYFNISEIPIIKELLKTKIPAEIATMYSVDVRIINNIKSGRTYDYVE